MANTYTQIHMQTVFAVQNRHFIIKNEWKEKLYKYITGIIQNYGHKLLAINGMPDHVHIFFGMRPNQSLSDLMKEVKRSSSLWINEQSFVKGNFSWQEGYGGFSYSKSQVQNVIQYIRQQEAHHSKKSFIQEYREFLVEFGIDYNDWYLFKSVDY